MAVNRDIENDLDWFPSLPGGLKGGDVVLAVRDGKAHQVGFAEVQSGLVAGAGVTGWAQHQDTQYTEASPFALSADTDTILPNNNGAVIDSQKPSDVVTFYDGSVITGRNGDGLGITIDLTARPSSVAATSIEIWVDIGGAVGELYRLILAFPKGNGVARPVNFSVLGYTLGTWEANGATVYVRSNGNVDLYDIRYVLTRTHKAA